MPAAISAFFSYCNSKNLSENTIIYYGYRLKSFKKYLEKNFPSIIPSEMTSPIIRNYIAYESKQNSPSTANHSIITLRAFFNYLVKDELLERSPMSGVEKVRNKKAVILILLDCGLRASEACDLMLKNVSWDGQTMLVHGKGDKERIVPFGQTTRSALTQYCVRRGDLEAEQLFVSCYGEPIDRRFLGEMIKERCKEAGIDGIRCSPHTLRHTFAVQYLRNGGDAFSLQKLLGHSDLTMTRRYVELSETDVLEKHRAYSPADKLQMDNEKVGRKRLR